jgi:hypothetical protein
MLCSHQIESSICSFELCDLDQWHLPYPNEYFDVIHARVCFYLFKYLISPPKYDKPLLVVDAHRSEPHVFLDALQT